ncbi:MAG: hypothetical protein AAGF30_08990 [Pseudomonadota bacterium]
MLFLLGLTGLMAAAVLMFMPMPRRNRFRSSAEAKDERATQGSLDESDPTSTLFRAPSAGAWADAEDAPTITDFDPSLDRLEITYEPDTAPAPRVSIAPDPDGTIITLDGMTVARVTDAQGITLAHIDLIRAA